MPTILVADQEINTVDQVTRCLAREGHTLLVAYDVRELLARLEWFKADLVLLEPRISPDSGLAICRQIAIGLRTPVMIVSGCVRDADKIAGFEAGADDYVAKPFSRWELVARVRAVLRRYCLESPQKPVLDVGDLTIDTARRKATISGQNVTFRRREFDLLTAFATRPDEPIRRSALLSQVWGDEYLGDPQTLDVHVSWLRRKLAGSQVRIESVRGIGYRLVDIKRETAAVR